ncbi:MAG: RimK family protein, partial [Oceanospirillales bacterium]|nr:RimK family protein [Oceanospirillales bacterium]
MSKLRIIVDKKEDWQAFYPAEELMSAHEYLAQGTRKESTPVQIINLCQNYRYLSYGYYTSLLAEARGHKVIPSIQTINDLGRKSVYGLGMKDLNTLLGKLVDKHAGLREQLEAEQCLKVTLCFGHTLFAPLQDLARQIFEQFPCPILHLTFRKDAAWEIETVKAGNLTLLTEEEEDLFATAIDMFSRKLWRKPAARKKYRYDLAILVDHDEQLPPSDPMALKHFIRAGRQLGIDVSLIGKKDYSHLAEYDGLFIRETTSISNHTYRFAKKAEHEGLVVFDDPTSILRCCNNVYLADLLAANGVATPETHLLYKGNRKELTLLARSLSYPRVLKIPDGAFSKGVVKVGSPEELIQQAEAYFKQSAIVL